MDMSLDPQKIGSLFELSRDAVMGIQDGKILFVNPAASAMFGAKVGDKSSKYIPDSLLSDPAEHFLATIDVYGLSCQLTVTRDEALTIASIIIPQEPQIPSYVNRAMREMSDVMFSSKLAMDLIISRSGVDEDPGLSGYVGTLYKSYYNLKRSCSHISAASALNNGTRPFKLELIYLDRVLQDICATADRLSSEQGIRIYFSAAPGSYSTMADSSLLEIMMLNLLSNSLAHSTKDSTVDVKLERESNRFVISINDRGTGIPKSKLLNLYRAIETDEEEEDGLGLGLSIARNAIERHDGSLILESQEGIGTKIRISLPVKTPTEFCVHEPSLSYKTEGMDPYITEFSVILDKKFFSKTRAFRKIKFGK